MFTSSFKMNQAKYRDVTYEMDKDFARTTSWSDGLNEEHQFVPHLPYVVRRTNSSDDIDRYKRYFSLAQSNQGKLLTWRYYLNILNQDLRHFDTAIIMAKMMLEHAVTPVNSEVSTYMTASERLSNSSKIKSPGNKRFRKLTFKRKKILGDAESISSMDDISICSNLSLTPETNLLKKMCTDIKALAHKTCKTVEKMATKSKIRSACGDNIENVKIHKDCSQPFRGANNCKKRIIPGVNAKDTIMEIPEGGGELLIDKFGKPMDTVMESPEGGGELPTDKLSKMTLAMNFANKMKPFTKKTPKKVFGDS